MSELRFRISAALKDIIGQDLITNDYVAIFELVKNSYDAHATRVDITFSKLNADNAKIIIQDDGKGMDHKDVREKWLFVAYSAKKEGTEDYRDKIYSNRPFAGAKGIGRFSCDRLGAKLRVETTKKNKRTEVLVVDWEKFEKDVHEEFINIDIQHRWRKENSYGLKHGTVLEISEVRSSWERTKLLKLKDSLAKLITPTNTRENNFKIFLNADREQPVDEKQRNKRNIVNGEIKNFIFDALGLKTTRITASITQDGKLLTTKLVDGGTVIYQLTEPNKFKPLNDINITLYYLNRSAKSTFARQMGLASRRYGHVFLYKNGFRIYPFGEPDDDPLKIELRKSRKTKSRLGTGELMGQIEVFGNNPNLKETSSRGNGLIKNKSYDQLEAFFLIVLERLEKYVIDVQKWGLSIEDGAANNDLKDRITQLIGTLTGSTQILDIQYPDNFLEILEASQQESAESVVRNLNRIAFESGNSALIDVAKKASKKLEEIKHAKEEAEREAEEAQGKLEEKISENLFLKSIKSQDFTEVVSFLHQTGISASIVDNYLTAIYKDIEDGMRLTSEEVRKILRLVIFENKKILNISKFATKANFKLSTEAIELNFDEYIKEYVQNVVSLSTGEQFKITFKNFNKHPLAFKFRPIEINILVDNLVNNAKKANANKFDVIISRNKQQQYQIAFADNGKGIPKENLPKIFDFGFTTTQGSGIGLFHIKEIVDKLNGKITVESIPNQGTKFIITLK